MGRAPFWPNDLKDEKILGAEEVQKGASGPGVFDPAEPEEYGFTCRTEPLFAAMNPKHTGPTSVVFETVFGSAPAGIVRTTPVLDTADLAILATLPIPGQLIIDEGGPNEETIAYYKIETSGSSPTAGAIFSTYTQLGVGPTSGDTLKHASFAGINDDMIPKNSLAPSKVKGTGLNRVPTDQTVTQTINSGVSFDSRLLYNQVTINQGTGGAITVDVAGRNIVLVINSTLVAATMTIENFINGVTGQRIFLFTGNPGFPGVTRQLSIEHDGAGAGLGPIRLKNGGAPGAVKPLSNFYGTCFINMSGIWYERGFLD